MVSAKAKSSEFMLQMQRSLAKVNTQISNSVSFLGSRLGQYKQMTLGEQIAYPCLLFGIILFLLSLFLLLL